MKRIVIWLTIVTVWLIHLTSSPVLSAQDRRIALVIGNGAYKSAPLRNPVNDASDIADALERLGFSVSLKTDANQRNMKKAIRAFGKQLRKGGVGLFYFAGHGIQVKGSNYLIPIGAEIETEPDVEYEAVDAGRVLAQMEDAGNNLNIIILDACRDNPFGRSFRSSNRGLAQMDAPTGSILAYATAPGSVAADGTGKNGLYTSALLKYIMTPGLKIEDIFKKVRIDVIQTTDLKQVPWEASSLTGDFYFNPQRAVVVVERPKKEPRQPIKPPKDELESIAEELRKKRESKIFKFKHLKEDLIKYEEIKNASLNDQQTMKTAWAVIEKKYPNWIKDIPMGNTKEAIKQILADDKEGSLYEFAVPEDERKYWENAKNYKTEQNFKVYLRNFPDGFHSEEAQKELTQLIAENAKRAVEERKKHEERRKRLLSNIAGIWLIKTNPNHPFYKLSILNGLLEIHQDGKNISFFQTRPNGVPEVFIGTYENGKIIGKQKSESGSYSPIEGYISSDGLRIDLKNTIIRIPTLYTLNRTNPKPDDKNNYQTVIPNFSSVGIKAGCFIATAAYGSPWKSNVLTLRKFREQWLNPNAAGRLFVKIYYNLSPSVADFIATKEWFRMIARGLLTPVVIIAGALIGYVLDIIIVVISSLILCALFFFFIKRKKVLTCK